MIPLTTDVAGAFGAFAADASAPGWLIVFSSAKLPAVGSGRRRPESLLCAQQSRALTTCGNASPNISGCVLRPARGALRPVPCVGPAVPSRPADHVVAI